MKCQHINVLLLESGRLDRLADKIRFFWNIYFGYAITTADREPLTKVNFGKINMRGYMVNDRSGYI